MFLFVFTGVGGVLRFPWHMVRGMDRCRCEKSLRVFHCCLISIPLLSFQTVVIYEDKCLHIMRGEMSSIKDKGVIVVQIAMVVTLVM